MKPILTALFVLTVTSSPTLADINIRFVEGAPKDRFIFSNDSKCDLKSAKITLDLSGSDAGLIFDVTESGAGVEVYQPLEFVAGANTLRAIPSVKDGDNRIELEVVSLDAGEQLAFTIDVDDTLGGREIIVDGSEIQGAGVFLETSGRSSNASFDANSTAAIKLGPCNIS